MPTIVAQLRSKDTNPTTLREEGLLPAVVYGAKETSTPVALVQRDFERVWKTAGETTVIAVQGLGDEKQVLIHEVQFHPVTGTPLHVDLYAIAKGQKVQVSIPLEFIGVAPAEKSGGVVVKTVHEVEISVSPAELPHTLIIDLSSLEQIGDHIFAKDIALPKSATLKIDPEELIVVIAAVKEEKPEPVAPVPETAPAKEASSPEATENA